MDNFDKQLDSAINDIGSSPDKIEKVTKTLEELESAEEVVSQLKSDLKDLGEELCALVSAEMKKLLPKVKITLDRGGCTFSYYARSLTLRPNIKKRTWEIQPGPHSKDKRLAKFVIDKLEDGTPLSEYKTVVRGIAETFVKKYSTLQGGKVELPPEEEEISDDQIDQAIDAISATDAPPGPAGRAIERKGTSKTPGGAHYE